MTHQKRQNIGDSSGNRLFLDWFITEDTMKKRPDSFFNFLFGQERIGRLFDPDARRSGPTIHFDEVDPNIEFMEAYRRLQIRSDWIRLDHVDSDWIRLDQIGSD